MSVVGSVGGTQIYPFQQAKAVQQGQAAQQSQARRSDVGADGDKGASKAAPATPTGGRGGRLNIVV